VVGREGVYGALGLPINFLDRTGRRLGGTIARLLALEGRRPSAWLDCGRGATATPYADQYDVALTVATRVVSAGESSTVETVVRAFSRARDVTAAPLDCTSLRTLEARIAEPVEERAR